MSALPSVRARLAERFIFNFRMPLEVMAKYLPAPWLEPQALHGFGVASYCLLDLRNITVAPLPPWIGLTSLSCAPRYAAVDRSGPTPRPVVFVTERQTNSAFGAWFTSRGFSAPHPHVEASITHREDGRTLQVHRTPEDLQFSASVRPAPACPSPLFSSPAAFAAFIAVGVSSYGLSRHPGRLTEVDLHKEETVYEPLAVTDMRGLVIEEWLAGGAVFDSAFRTWGGGYQWTYRGLTP